MNSITHFEITGSPAPKPDNTTPSPLHAASIVQNSAKSATIY